VGTSELTSLSGESGKNRTFIPIGKKKKKNREDAVHEK